MSDWIHRWIHGFRWFDSLPPWRSIHLWDSIKPKTMEIKPNNPEYYDLDRSLLHHTMQWAIRKRRSRVHSPPVITMPQSRLPRNVHVFDNNVPEGTQSILVAGFQQFGLTTGGEFYFCLEFCFQEPRPSNFRLWGEDGTILPRDGTIVPIQNYYVISAGMYYNIFRPND